MKSTFSICCLIIVLSMSGCRDHIIDSDSGTFTGGANSLCYTAPSDNGYWNIYIADLAGSSPRNISNISSSSEYPQWSPDGRYILYSRSGAIIAYDTKNRSETNLTKDGAASQTPRWLPNGKACLTYLYAVGPYRGTYILNPDGTGRKRILDSAATADVKLMYFYPDSYNFLYVVNYTQVYKSNCDGTANSLVVDLQQFAGPNVAIQGFNPATEELLLTTSTAIETYSMKTKGTRIVASVDNGYTLFRVTYSTDCSKIAMIEHSEQDEYLSVIDNGRKTRLVKIATGSPLVTFSFNPMQFSPDGNYIAFSKQTWGTGDWISFKDELYVVQLATRGELKIGEGHDPSWNPNPY